MKNAIAIQIVRSQEVGYKEVVMNAFLSYFLRTANDGFNIEEFRMACSQPIEVPPAPDQPDIKPLDSEEPLG